jgi:serine phosphatase RsbU (regulator of sigma subunit)
MEIQIGAAKVAKYACRESGDTLEIIERPHGGISAVLVDGQRSGRAAKIVSNIVARKAISLLGEGVRDGAVARATHDYLRTHRGGQVSAELQILSADFATGTLVISRNSQCPALLWQDGQLSVLDAPSQAIGIHANTKPSILELPMCADMYVLLHTDGLLSAGVRCGKTLDVAQLLEHAAQTRASAQSCADIVLQAALELEQHRPTDDISVLLMAILPSLVVDKVRRYSASLPVDWPLKTG